MWPDTRIDYQMSIPREVGHNLLFPYNLNRQMLVENVINLRCDNTLVITPFVACLHQTLNY